MENMRGEVVKNFREKKARTQLVSIQYIHMPTLKIQGQPRWGCGKLPVK
jgi:hypothetical protein